MHAPEAIWGTATKRRRPAPRGSAAANGRRHLTWPAPPGAHASTSTASSQGTATRSGAATRSVAPSRAAARMTTSGMKRANTLRSRPAATPGPCLRPLPTDKDMAHA